MAMSMQEYARIYEPYGPSATNIRPAYSLQKHDYAMLEHRPCKITHIIYQKDQYGNDEKHFLGRDVFRGHKYEECVRVESSLHAPIIHTKEYAVEEILDNGFMNLSLCNEKPGGFRQDVRLPDAEYGAKIKAHVTEKKKIVYCTVLCWRDEAHLIGTRFTEEDLEDY